MFRRNLAAAWFGIVVLSGMFLMGQESWPPPVELTRPAPDTGITLCYDVSSQMTACPASTEPFYGQDAQYSTHPMAFGTGTNTVTDNVTKVVWQRQDDDTARNFATAQTYCADLVLASQSDWRLPNVYELHSIADLSQYGPAVNATVFPGITAVRYWSVTANAGSPGNVWTVDFTSGAVTSVSAATPNLVMCVRGTTEATASLSDNGDGTVTDSASGLVWQQEDDNTKRTWEAALDYCEDLVLPLGGNSSWRLPNAKELRNLLDTTTSAPAIDAVLFPNTNLAKYWTSSTTVNTPGAAWCTLFSTGAGSSNTKSNNNTVFTRCVRTQ